MSIQIRYYVGAKGLINILILNVSMQSLTWTLLALMAETQLDRRPSRPACPRLLGHGTNKVKKCTVRKIVA